MAMGDVNQQNRRDLNDQFYSRMKFSSKNLSMGFGFWKGMLKISISEKAESNNGGFPQYNEVVYIHLSPTKARILKHEIKKFLAEPATVDTPPRGVNTGSSDVQGMIFIGNREDSTPDIPRRYMTIGKVDASGNIVDSCEFDFNSNYHFGVVFTNTSGQLQISKEYYDDLEIEQFVTFLDEYIWSANGSTGYFTTDLARYQTARIENKIDDIATAVGVEKKSSGGQTNRSNGDFNKSFFASTGGADSRSNSNRGRSSTTSFDEIEDTLL